MPTRRSWGEVDLEPEVSDWFLGSSETDQARCASTSTASAILVPYWTSPTPCSSTASSELRFYLAGRATRITYWIAPGRRVILLTVFVKTQRHEVREIRRATEAMHRCVAEGHLAENEEE